MIIGCFAHGTSIQ